MSKMKEITLEKVTVNIGVGEPGGRLEKAKNLLEKITGKKAVITKGKKRTTFGTSKGRPIGTKVTLRGKQASEFLKNALKAKANKLMYSQFDSSGNFSFGIEEYINMPGIKYDSEIGMFGMDIAVTLTRPGYRIRKKMIRPAKVGKKHLIQKTDAMEFAKKQLGVEVKEK